MSVRPTIDCGSVEYTESSLHSSSSLASLTDEKLEICDGINQTSLVSSNQRSKDDDMKHSDSSVNKKFKFYMKLILTLLMINIGLVSFIACLVTSSDRTTKNIKHELLSYGTRFFNFDKTIGFLKRRERNDTCPYGFVGDKCQYECGLTFTPPNLRIVGGSIAQPHSWPSDAYILFKYKARVYLRQFDVFVLLSFTASCGGSLINTYTILTAAHCIPKEAQFSYKGHFFSYAIRPNGYYPTWNSMLEVYLGLQDKLLIKTGNIYPAVQVSVGDIIIHENYNFLSQLNDVALLKLTSNVTLNRYIQLACLPESQSDSFPSAGTVAYATGWGTVAYLGQSSDDLRNVKLEIYDSNKCQRVAPMTTKNWNSQICAGDLNGGKDTCQGDSGGSLFVEKTFGNKTRYVSAGIVSYGDGCGEVGSPGVYTRVSYYLDW